MYKHLFMECRGMFLPRGSVPVPDFDRKPAIFVFTGQLTEMREDSRENVNYAVQSSILMGIKILWVMEYENDDMGWKRRKEK